MEVGSKEEFQHLPGAFGTLPRIQQSQSHHNGSSNQLFEQHYHQSQPSPVCNSTSLDNINAHSYFGNHLPNGYPTAENDIEPYSPLHLRHMSLEEVTITPRNQSLMTGNNGVDDHIQPTDISAKQSTRPLRTAIPPQLVMPDHRSFHGIITGDQADQILMTNRKERCYLTRYSTNQEAYVLSIKVPGIEHPLHYRLKIDNNACRYELSGTQVTFDSLDKLLSHYENNYIDGLVQSIGSPCVYRNMLKRTQSMHGGLATADSSALLADIIRAQQEQHAVMLRNYSELMVNQQTFFQQMFQMMRMKQESTRAHEVRSEPGNRQRRNTNRVDQQVESYREDDRYGRSERRRVTDEEIEVLPNGRDGARRRNGAELEENRNEARVHKERRRSCRQQIRVAAEVNSEGSSEVDTPPTRRKTRECEENDGPNVEGQVKYRQAEDADPDNKKKKGCIIL